MEIDFNNLEDMLFDMLDQIKMLLSEELWENIFLNATKNELLVMMVLYRNSDVNMSQLAQYLGVPLNTATGIVARMEKKALVERGRSIEDKRVVTIAFTHEGKEQVKNILQSFMYYGQKIILQLSAEELKLIGKVVTKVITLLNEEREHTSTSGAKVRKISID